MLFNHSRLKLLIQEIRLNTSLDLHLPRYNLAITDFNFILQELKHNCSITSVDFSHNKIDIATAKSLNETLLANKSIRTLMLNNCDLKTEGLNAIAPGLVKSPSLVRVELQNNDIGDFDARLHEIIKQIKDNQVMRRIDFTGNKLIRENSLRKLENSNLYEVVFPGTAIGTKFSAPKTRP